MPSHRVSLEGHVADVLVEGEKHARLSGVVKDDVHLMARNLMYFPVFPAFSVE